MILRTHCLFAVAAICLAFGQARAQDGQPGARPPAAPGTPALSETEKKYTEMGHSTDRVIKATAERYLGLVKFQEWGGANGKILIAKYISHDPDLKQVKLSVAKGTGKDRVVKEFDVEVDKLNKTSKDRVKQIDILQKRLDKLSAAQGDHPGGQQGPGGQGGERAAHPQPGPEGPPVGPPPQQGGPSGPLPQAAATAPEADSSASEPDPIGFGELPAATPPAGPAAGFAIPPGAPVGPPPTSSPVANPAPASAPAKSVSSAQGKEWRTNLAAFTSNISVSEGPNHVPAVSWGELKELGEINDILVAQRGPEPPARSPEAESPAAISERLGDMHWQIVVDKVDAAPGGLVVPSFHPVDLPKPIEFRFVLDDSEDAQKWQKLPAGAIVPVSARLSLSEPYKITAKVKLADAK